MKPSAQRLVIAIAALLVLLLALLGVVPGDGRWWRSSTRTSGETTGIDASNRMIPASPASTMDRQPANSLGRTPFQAQARPRPAAVPKIDRFAHCPVVEQREEVRREDGVEKVSRQRLVRDSGFKYPLIRVEDELIRRAGGDELIKQTAMVGDHVLVKPQDPKASEATVLAQAKAEGATVRRRMPASGTWLVAFPNPTLDTVPRAVARFSAMKPVVRFAEPDYILHTEAIPNDASFASLWGMHNTGQSGGVADADIDALEAWNLNTGSRSVIVAVIDSGIDQTHPDLIGNLWQNPNEIAGNGLDDDANGYIDDTRGWDFANGDSNPQDDHSHGTHVAGTIGAVGNNAAGVAGVCWQVSLVALKFLDNTGSGTLSDGVEAIAYATDLGVTVTSNSWGGGGYSQSMKEAIDEADTAGILFVAAAGNSGSDMELDPGYPASYPSSNVISVAATTRTDALASYSNYGSTTTDLAAPGSEIYSTVPSGSYGSNSGTSMATPHVSGACALLKAFKPNLTHSQIKDLILLGVDPLPALAGKTVTGGRLNVFNSMLASDDILVSPGSGFAASGPVGGPFAPLVRTYTLTNHGTVSASWTASVNASWVSLSATSGTLAPGQTSSVTVTINDGAADLLAGPKTANLNLTSLATGRTQVRTVSLAVIPPPLYVFDLETDPGWPHSDAWAYGAPTGQGGGSFGNPDPTAGATGARVFGINLNGDYAVAVAPSHYLTAGPFDLTDRQSSRIRFQRWLNSDYQPWVNATIQVSSDGVTWTTVWQNGAVSIEDTQWTTMDVDIAAVADGKPQVFVRWGHEVTRTDAYPLSGWNIDDVEIIAVPTRQLRLTLSSALSEGGADGVGRITIAPVLATDLVVQLVSSRPGEQAVIPTTVTVPAGAEQATFQIAALDDALVDGTQEIVITASAANYPSSAGSLLVHDNEEGMLTLTLPAGLTEAMGELSGQAQVSLPVPAAADITVSLASSDVTELTVPDSVVIPAGQTRAAITLTLPDDPLIDGARPVTVTASVANWPNATAVTSVADNEPLELTVSLPPVGIEHDATVTGGGMVTTAGAVEGPVVVALTSNDASELTVPAQVVIAAGTSGVSFDLHFQDDAAIDGPQSVQIVASASGFTSGSASIAVNDDETPALPVNPSPAADQSPTHPESDLAWEFDPLSGGVPQTYDVFFAAGSAPLSLLGSAASMQWSLPRLQPDAVYRWQVVSKIGAVTRSGPVWSFTVPPTGDVKRFGWSNLPNAVAAGAPFSASLTAFDDYDNVVTSFSGTAALSAIVPAQDTITGSGTVSWFFPLATYYHDARTQLIYTPAEVGSAGDLVALALDVATVPGQTMKSFTIRLKHTTKSSYSGTNNNTWESTDWTTVHQTVQTLSTTGWATFEFAKPFYYDGVSNLMVDICFNNNSYTTDGYCRASSVSSSRALVYRTDSGYGDPLAWSGQTPYGSLSTNLPNLRFRRADVQAPITPANTGAFANGAWTGEVTFTLAGAARLKAELATDPTVSSVSDGVQVIAIPNLLLNPEPPFTGGTSNVVSWNSLGAAYDYEIQRATMDDFSDAISTGFIAATDYTFADLLDGRLYHYRGRPRTSGVMGNWSPPVSSTQDNRAPVIVITPRSDGVTSADSIRLQGTGDDAVSGISTLTVNGLAANSGNAFADWNQLLLQLPEGSSSYTITAADHAEPPNTFSEIWTITRISDPAADLDANGVPALLEFAFNASGSGAHARLPAVVSDVVPETGQRHLILIYRRRINHESLDYVLEASPDLADWQPATADAEVLSIAPTGDGITEEVKMRLHPAMTATGVRFVRVRVLTP